MIGEDEVTRHECVDCRLRSPGDASEYTLFSSRHGWRVTKGTLPNGKAVLEWRCAQCFAKHRAAQAMRSERSSQAS